MRARKLIPSEYQQWLDAYLKHKSISNYPELDANQWQTLQGAYRQMLLKRKSVSSSLSGEKLLNRNSFLVSERDKAIAELRSIKNTLSGKDRVIEQRKDEIRALKKQLKQTSSQILGSGIYDGSIPLSIAVKLLSIAPKDSAKQSSLRQSAIVECGYANITERKLSQFQKVEVYNYIVKKLNP